MDNPYDVHSWSRLYREERLAEARERHLGRARIDREVDQAGPPGRPRNTKLAGRALAASLLATLVFLVGLLASDGCAPTNGPGTLGDRPDILDDIRLENALF